MSLQSVGDRSGPFPDHIGCRIRCLIARISLIKEKCRVDRQVSSGEDRLTQAIFFNKPVFRTGFCRYCDRLRPAVSLIQDQIFFYGRPILTIFPLLKVYFDVSVRVVLPAVRPVQPGLKRRFHGKFGIDLYNSGFHYERVLAFIIFFYLSAIDFFLIINKGCKIQSAEHITFRRLYIDRDTITVAGFVCFLIIYKEENPALTIVIIREYIEFDFLCVNMDGHVPRGIQGEFALPVSLRVASYSKLSLFTLLSLPGDSTDLIPGFWKKLHSNRFSQPGLPGFLIIHIDI